MDRELDGQTRSRRRARSNAVFAAAGVAVLLILTCSVGWLRPSVTQSSLRTATVTRGPIESVIEASGVVIPRTGMAS